MFLKKLSKVPSWLTVAISIGVVEMATDMFVSSLPEISDFYSVSEASANLLVVCNLVGIGLSSLLYGPLSKEHGRKTILRVGFGLFTLGGLFACLLTMSPYFGINAILFSRFFQGLGAGVTFSVAIASIKDKCSGKEFSSLMSRISAVICISPSLAPIIGGYIAKYLSWQSVFLVLFIISLLCYILILSTFEETLPLKYRCKFSLKSVVSSYTDLIYNKIFIAYSSIRVLSFTWLGAEVANLPHIYETGMSLPAEKYGYYFASGVVVYVLGTKVNSKYVLTYGVDRMLQIGVYIGTICSFSLLFSHFIFELNPLLIQIIKAPGAFALALVITNILSKALEHVKGDAASAIAFMGTLEIMGNSIAAYMVGYFYNGTILPLAICMCICVGLGFTIYCLIQDE